MFHSEVKYGPRLHVYLCHVGSQDDVHPADALRVQDRNSCGWVSWRSASYPQELGFRFDGVVSVNTLRLLVNESKIPSSMMVFVAEPTAQEEQDGVCGPYSNADFKHIGHVRFSENAASDYQARELKTVNLHCRCTYLKLLLRTPHVNRYNIFQQVGIVALAAHGKLIKKLQDWIATPLAIHVGERVTMPLDEMMPPFHSDCTPNILAKLVSIHAARIRELAALKQKAVEEEDFDTAESLKQRILAIEDGDREVVRLEVEKQQAVMMEDYKQAKVLKLRIEMLQSELERMAENSPTKMPSAMNRTATGPLVPHDLFVSGIPAGAAVNNHGEGNGTAASHPSPRGSNAHDEVVVRGKGYYDFSDATGGLIGSEAGNQKGADGDEIALAGEGAAWEVSLNAAIKRESKAAAGPIALSGDAAAAAKPYAKDLGVYCTACLFSRKGQQREAALRGVVSNEGCQALATHSDVAWSQLILYMSVKGYGIGDQVAGAAIAACSALRKIVQGKVLGASVAQVAESVTKVLPEVTARLGDSNPRVQESMERTVVDLARSPFGHRRIVDLLLLDPDKQNKKPASARAHITRISLLSTFVDDFGLACNTPDGLDARSLCTMVLLPSLQHSNADVRDAAIDLLAKLLFLDPGSTNGYVENIKPAQQALVEEHLLQYKQSHLVVPGISRETSDIQTEILSAQQNGMDSTDSQTVQPPSPSVPHSSETEIIAPEESQSRVPSVLPLEGSPVSDSESEYHRLFTCQFCGEYDSGFNEHNLDLHYMGACPMLCPCPLCDQVTEICQLQQHLVTECEKRGLVRECPRCQEAVRAAMYHEHVAAGRCIKAVSTHSVCPLCHERFQSGMGGWRHHLASNPGCPNNPRRFDGSGLKA